MTFAAFLQNLQSTLVVRHIAAFGQELRTVTSSEPREAAQAIMAREVFDILPVDDGDSISRYYERQAHGLPRLKQIAVADVVGADLPLLEVIQHFAESGRWFYLTLGGRRIDGIVTRADLNKPAVRVLIYAILNQFELLLGKVVEGHYEGTGWLALLGDSRAKVEQRLAGARSKNMELHPIAYVDLPDIVRICSKTPGARRMLGVDSEEQLWSDYTPLLSLRNKIAHPVRALVTAARDVQTLRERIDIAVEAVSRLEQGLHSSQS